VEVWSNEFAFEKCAEVLRLMEQGESKRAKPSPGDYQCDVI